MKTTGKATPSIYCPIPSSARHVPSPLSRLTNIPGSGPVLDSVSAWDYKQFCLSKQSGTWARWTAPGIAGVFYLVQSAPPPASKIAIDDK